MLTTLFSLPAHLLVEDVLIEDQVLTLLIRSTLTEVSCPECRQPFSRVHSRYTRMLADLPCLGRAVRLLIQVRRFFCDEPACPPCIHPPPHQHGKTSTPITTF